MNTSQRNNQNTDNPTYKITPKGSLGLLALGDIGLREWRKIKKEALKKAPK